jgi:colanic acid/amylovoran biosynthesis protein
MKKILLIDLWTDANSGDLALQAGLIRMLRDKHPKAEIVGIFRFGWNEFEQASPEIKTTRAFLDRSFGGLRRTYYAGANHSRFSGLLHKLISLYSFLELACVLLFVKLGLKVLLPHTHQTVCSEISSADVVVWKGKNFRSYGGLSGINRQTTLLVGGIVANMLNNNVYCLNASIWAMKNVVERWMVCTVLGMCKSVSVRDQGSLDTARSFGLSNYFFAHDLSFYFLHSIQGVRCEKRRNNAVALTITQWGSDQEIEQYFNSLIATVSILVGAGVNEIYIVPQVTRAAESNRLLVTRIKKKLAWLKQDITLHDIVEEQSIPQLLKLYSRCQLLIGTRMHSCVFARFVNTPFIGIAYDDGPKWDILREFWPKEFIVPYAVEEHELAKKALKVYQNGEDLIRQSEALFSELPASSIQNIRDI